MAEPQCYKLSCAVFNTQFPPMKPIPAPHLTPPQCFPFSVLTSAFRVHFLVFLVGISSSYHRWHQFMYSVLFTGFQALKEQGLMLFFLFLATQPWTPRAVFATGWVLNIGWKQQSHWVGTLAPASFLSVSWLPSCQVLASCQAPNLLPVRLQASFLSVSSLPFVRFWLPVRLLASFL